MLPIKKHFIIATILLIGMPFSSEAGARHKIGILLFAQKRHDKEILNGVKDQLKKEGIGESNADFTVKNAEGNKSKSVELAQTFAADKMDLVIVPRTTATLIAMNEIKDIPIVFSMVYDPVDSKIVRDWKSSGNNTTGSSSAMPMSYAIHALKGLAPVKKLAVFYQPNEKNSVSQLRGLQNEQRKGSFRFRRHL